MNGDTMKIGRGKKMKNDCIGETICGHDFKCDCPRYVSKEDYDKLNAVAVKYSNECFTYSMRNRELMKLIDALVPDVIDFGMDWLWELKKDADNVNKKVW